MASPPFVKIQIHAFADANQCAYGACIYIRCVDVNNKITCNLLCSKTRVVPEEQMHNHCLTINYGPQWLLCEETLGLIVRVLNYRIHR